MELEEIEPSLIVYTSNSDEKNTFNFETSIDRWTDFITDLHRRRPFTKVHFIAHGFLTSDDATWMMEMKGALIQASTENIVVIVGWEEGAYSQSTIKLMNYPSAIKNLETVGNWVGPFVKALRDAFSDIRIHGIGHSLGAHLMGFAGRASGKAFNRITGLDPAGPLFEGEQAAEREFEDRPEKMLCKNNADMVDIIHTDGVMIVPSWRQFMMKIPYVGYIISKVHFGTLVPMGSLDFYPNFGIAPQPGAGLRHVDEPIRNSHSRAHMLFTWSIRHPGAFKTRLALSKPPEREAPVQTTTTSDEVEMGYFADTYPVATGNYYIKTTSGEPWVKKPRANWLSGLNPIAHFRR